MIIRRTCYACQEAGRVECDREGEPAGFCRNCRANRERVCRWPVVAASIDDRTTSNADGPPPKIRNSAVVQNFWSDQWCRFYFDSDEEARSLAFRTSTDAPSYQVKAVEAVFQIIQAIRDSALEEVALEDVQTTYYPVFEAFENQINQENQRSIGITLAWVNIFERFVRPVEHSCRYQHLHLLRNLVDPETAIGETLTCGVDHGALPCVVIKSLIYHTAVGSTFTFPYVAIRAIEITYVEELLNRLPPTGGAHCCRRQDSFHQVPLSIFRCIYEICWIRSQRNLHGLSVEDRNRLLSTRNSLQDSSFLSHIAQPTHEHHMTELYRRTCLLLVDKFLRPQMTCGDAYTLFEFCLQALNPFQGDGFTTPAITWPLLVLFFATTPDNRPNVKRYFHRFGQFAIPERTRQLVQTLDQIADQKTQQEGEDGLFNMLLGNNFEDLQGVLIS